MYSVACQSVEYKDKHQSVFMHTPYLHVIGFQQPGLVGHRFVHHKEVKYLLWNMVQSLKPLDIPSILNKICFLDSHLGEEGVVRTVREATKNHISLGQGIHSSSSYEHLHKMAFSILLLPSINFSKTRRNEE